MRQGYPSTGSGGASAMASRVRTVSRFRAVARTLSRRSNCGASTLRPIPSGSRIVKYGAPIGVATRDIGAGEYVHTHNMTSDYLPTYTLEDGRQFVKEVK